MDGPVLLHARACLIPRKQIALEGDIKRTSRLYDRIGPVGRFDEKNAHLEEDKYWLVQQSIKETKYNNSISIFYLTQKKQSQYCFGSVWNIHHFFFFLFNSCLNSWQFDTSFAGSFTIPFLPPSPQSPVSRLRLHQTLPSPTQPKVVEVNLLCKYSCAC